MLRTGGLPVLLLVAGTFPVWPQQIETDVAVLDRLRSVRTAYSLEIDRARAEAMLRVLEPVSKLQSDYASWAAEQWKANSTKVHAAISAWAASRQPAAEEAQAAPALLEGARDRQTRIDEAVLNAAPQATAALGAAGKT
ncbi:MAG: hypothetical protein H5T86_13870, partial [Armatimonadetes bacterium]|nr:hypothetical protein [Armatimonadota bacterium]